ncbi:MAG: uridine diphosphate-N-acetylglucosamine-binding protein YvcK [Acidobacteria bacterium]|nr:uridine diphosphate-N-acetylglucosamine-binding protein YvcK [Acidobacteriota bacterium]MCA1641082.1 uridine diphosphate-N-acetylglucosamine-binding protein YvcK [Acidobacteriota bacterium]
MHTGTERGIKLVALGGGTGLSTLLSGLKRLVGADSRGGLRLESLAAIVTVSDDGGSSGRLRDELQMLPPGDIRNCMVALSEDSSLISRLFRYRFPGDGNLGGHSFGNLFLAALTAVTGDFVEAVRLSSEVLASKGHIYPATLNDVRLVAELEDGTEVRGETNITASRPAIRRLRLEPEQCLPLPEALTALRTADVITVGPGSLYTSILPNLLVARVAESIGESDAVKIFVCNLMTQPGETDGYTARRHLEVVKRDAPEIEFDYVVVNNRRVSEEQAEAYAAEGARQIGLTDHMLEREFSGEAEVVRTDLLDEGEKVRHSPEKLARVILACCEQARAHKHNVRAPEVFA